MILIIMNLRFPVRPEGCLILSWSLAAFPTVEVKSVTITPSADESGKDSAKVVVDCLV